MDGNAMFLCSGEVDVVDADALLDNGPKASGFCEVFLSETRV
jgi:hypothetical protein